MNIYIEIYSKVLVNAELWGGYHNTINNKGKKNVEQKVNGQEESIK